MQSITDDKNRIDYAGLKELIGKLSISEFVGRARHPLLVSKGVYDGIMCRNSHGLGTDTVRFSLNPKSVASPGASFFAEPLKNDSHLLFRLAKKRGGNATDGDSFYIGRSNENDLVIVDSVISKMHAVIFCRDGLYYISDMGSTNGTTVDDFPVASGKTLQIKDSSRISFGRLGFVLAHPLSVYRAVRKDIHGA